MTFNFIHFPVTDQPQPEFFISGPTKRPARGRENDLIGLLLYFHGRQSVGADELRQWHERLSAEYFRTSGSVTAAMKAVVEAAGKHLFQANDPFGDESNWRAAPGRQAGGSIADCHEIGDTLHASKIYAEARKLEGPRVIVKTGSHKALLRRFISEKGEIEDQ